MTMTPILKREIAKITDTFLGVEDHGMWTAFVRLDYGGSSQGAGQYQLDQHVPAGEREGTAFGMTWIMRLCEACGVDQWEKLKGRTVFAVIEDGLVRGIEPLPTEPGRAFDFRDLPDQFRRDDGSLR